MVSTPRSHRGVDELLRLLQAERHALLASGDRHALLSLLESLVRWAEGAAPSIQVRILAEAAVLRASDLGDADGSEEMFLRVLALAPANFSITDSARRFMHAPFTPRSIDRIFLKQASLLEAAPMPPSVCGIGWCRLGALRAELSDRDGAIEAFEIALEVAPNLTALLGLAEQLEGRAASGDLKDAADLLRLAAELSETEQSKLLLKRADRLEQAKPAFVPAPVPPQSLPKTDTPPATPDSPISLEVDIDDADIAGPEHHAPIRLTPTHAANSMPPQLSNQRRYLALAMVAFGLVLAGFAFVGRSLLTGPSAPVTTRADVPEGRAPAATSTESGDDGPALEVAVAAASLQTAAAAPVRDDKPSTKPKPRFFLNGKIIRMRGGSLSRAALFRALRETDLQSPNCERAASVERKQDALAVRFVVERSGRVKSVRTPHPRDARNPLFACTRDALRATHFPRPRGGSARLEGVLELNVHAAKNREVTKQRVSP